MNDDEEMYIDPNMKLKQVYDYFPYNHWRIKRILEENFNYRLENIWQVYKANCYKDEYIERYRLIENGTDRIINPCITLDQIRRIFANADIPLYNEKSSCNQSEHNQGAQRFLDAVNSIKNSTKED